MAIDQKGEIVIVPIHHQIKKKEAKELILVQDIYKELLRCSKIKRMKLLWSLSVTA